MTMFPVSLKRPVQKYTGLPFLNTAGPVPWKGLCYLKEWNQFRRKSISLCKKEVTKLVRRDPESVAAESSLLELPFQKNGKRDF